MAGKLQAMEPALRNVTIGHSRKERLSYVRVQITLTVAEAKWLIAKAIAQLPEVRRAQAEGSILFKGGTTVSAVCEELCGEPLAILGRISPAGARTSAAPGAVSRHCALLRAGILEAVQERLEAVAESLGPADVIIVGANAIDAFGHAAMMIGVRGGGAPWRVLAGVMADHAHVLIAVGSEKLVPGNLQEILTRTSRLDVDRADGMAVGLVPLVGKVITEVEALQILGGVDCWIIGKGGIGGAEGATTLVAQGSKEAITAVLAAVAAVRGKGHSGIPQTLPDCSGPSRSCAAHRACHHNGVRS